MPWSCVLCTSWQGTRCPVPGTQSRLQWATCVTSAPLTSLPVADAQQPRGRLKRRRVQRRWGVRQAEAQTSRRQQVQQGRRQTGGRGTKRLRQEREGEQQQQQQEAAEQQAASARSPPSGSPVAPAATAAAADAAQAAAEAGDVPLPVVPAVPAGLVQQLALLPGGRPGCGCCSACLAAANGDSAGCRTLAALKRWDALLPGLPLSELQQVRDEQRRCGRCRPCVLAAHGGGAAKKAACMALSRVRSGPLEGKANQLRQDRLQWAAAQQAAAARTAGADSGDEAAIDAQPGGSASSSDTEGSNRSRVLLRQQRRLKRQHQQPLPAPDGSLPLPLVPGVPWEAIQQAAASWTGSDTQPPRCGACPQCLQAQQAAQQQAGSGSVPRGQQVQQPRCAAATALVSWDRQLGPVTAAAVRSLAVLPAAQQAGARCGCCRQCRQPPPGKQLPCATGARVV